MKIKPTWDNEGKTIIRHIFERGWGWTDFHQALEQASVMMDEVDHRVDVILDFRDANLIPNGAITQVKKAYTNPKHHNVGTTIVIGANSFMQALVSVGTKLAPNSLENWDVEFARTLDEAYSIVTRKNSTSTGQTS
ncbi:MAG: hypothetical protein K8J31_29960 [Anaerolineae bacterium]|nr:hypothetical protein [Anaerolineae bacterium]